MRIETKNDPNETQVYPRIHGLVFDKTSGTLAQIDHKTRNEEIS